MCGGLTLLVIDIDTKIKLHILLIFPFQVFINVMDDTDILPAICGSGSLTVVLMRKMIRR